MKIGIVTDSLATLEFEEMLDTVVELGIAGIELNSANWSTAPHCDLEGLLESADARKRLLDAVESRGLTLFALNANGNQLHPTDGERQSKALYDTITLAGELGVESVSCMSGLPGGAPGDITPNWIVTSWPPETQTILRYQWEDVLFPYWERLAKHAEACGVDQLNVELHGTQLVYNVPTVLRLREEIGPVVGANMDPSHMMWMGGDPLAAIDALGSALVHVHAKDTYVSEANTALRTRLENAPVDDIANRSWFYITLGYGHSDQWWRDFCYRLARNGFEGWLSIEHEDMMLGRIEGVAKSVEVLKRVSFEKGTDYVVQDI